MHKKILALAAVPFLVLSFIPLVHADSSHSDDQIVSKDRDAYERMHLGTRFNIQFQPHKDVCDIGPGAHCDSRVITDLKGAPRAAQVVPLGLSPAQLLKAYNLTGTTSGRHIIAIVDAYDHPSIASDLATYNAMYHLPALPTCSGAIAQSATPCFKKVNQTGAASPLPATNAAWAFEIALDVEIAHAMCQNCSILLVEANSNSFADLASAVNQAVALGANEVSNSYGGAEFAGETSLDNSYLHAGVAIVASAGDAGYGVEYPAASRYVTAVGGTSLFLNPDNTYNQEIAWSGTGSGCSAYEQKPNLQADTGCANRMVVDVSAVADPNTGAAIYDSVRYNGSRGWFQAGGTSLAAPIIAATYALSNYVPLYTLENLLPYYMNPGANFRDVVNGSNGTCTTAYFCVAGVGYDGPTGLGTPKGAGAF